MKIRWIFFLLLVVGLGAFFLHSKLYPADGSGETSPKDSKRMAEVAMLHLRAYLTERGLEWKVFYAEQEGYYCAAAWKPPGPDSDPHLYHVECAYDLVKVTAAIISDYDLDKPGYREVLVLDSGSPETEQ